MKVGDVVILKDENIKCIFWKLAKVIELLREVMEWQGPHSLMFLMKVDHPRC